jgi:Tetratricopeptide repeat
VTQLAFDRLAAEDRAAGRAMAVCAFLAPEPVPPEWFTVAAAGFAGPLGETASDPLAWGRALARISGQALARIDGQGLLVHRLTQAVIRGHLPAAAAASARADAAALLAACHPGDREQPSTWPEWARLMPHLLALDLAASTPVLSALAVDAAWYLIRRGDPSGARDLATRLHRHLTSRVGPDDPLSLNAAATLAGGMRHTGRHAQARELDEDTLTRRLRVLGEDDPDTLASASCLAADLSALGEHEAARKLNEHTLARRLQVLGEDHPDTLASAGSLAYELFALGQPYAARELDEDTMTRRRRVLGEDNPWTLTSASYLAADLQELGEYQAARELNEDTLAPQESAR